MQNKPLRYLAIGDSYTIGESVPLSKNFPHQLVELLRNEKLSIDNPTIIAKTGWTTDELQDMLQRTRLQLPFDFVTILIGVNNQYRGRSIEEYAEQFTVLLEQAIGYASEQTDHVIVLSIPDWGVTPFAEGRDREQISTEINAFNQINQQIAIAYKVQYIDITPYTREALTDPTLVAEDGLHPSGKDYLRWAEKLKEIFILEISRR